MLAPDGKMSLRDAMSTKNILRLIESVPSPKAEPFKLWLANLGSERIDEVFNPEIAIKRDNMSDIEVLLTDLSEVATRHLANKHKPYGLEENKIIARMVGNTAKVARDDLEKKLKESVVTRNNELSYKYIDDNIQIENKSEK